MMSLEKRWNQIAGEVREQWTRHRQTALWCSVVVLALVSARRLIAASRELILGLALGDTPKIFHLLVRRWFASMPVYSESSFAVHPPASYVILWPFFGWLEITPARWFWLATMAAAILWLAYLIVRESGASTAVERAFVALLLLSMYATAATVRTGQLTIELLPLILVGLLLLYRRRPGLGRDFLSAALLLLALVKPTVSVPFLLLLLVIRGGLRPALLIAFGYVALTLFAAAYQKAGLTTLSREWLTRSSALAASAGTANLHIWLAAIGLQTWILPASLLALLGLGWWIHRHRQVDLWLLIAVSAIVTRFWTYHRPYDDVLLLLPEVALFRLAKRGPSDGGVDVVAAALLALTALGMLAPLQLPRLPIGWRVLFTDGNALVWFTLLLFLMKQAGREKNSGSALSEFPVKSTGKVE
jgi:hypothetical protein